MKTIHLVPFLRRTRLAVLCACLLQGAVQGAVVVIANRSEQPVSFAVRRSTGEAEQLSLQPRKVSAIRVRDTLEVQYDAGRTVLVEAAPNTVHCFSGAAERLRLEPLVLTSLYAKPPHYVDADPRQPAPALVPVRLAVDSALQQSEWEPAVRKRLATLFAFVERLCSVRFEIVAAAPWRPGAGKAAGDELTAEFRQRVPLDSAWLAIGISERWKLGAGQPLPHPVQGPFFSHVLLPEVQEGFSAGEQLRLLAHELGHFLGATHSADDDSLMRPVLHGGPSSLPPANVYDPINALVMNLVGDEIRGRQVCKLEGLSRSANRYLVAIYGEQGARLPADSNVIQVAALLREPVLPRLRYQARWTDGTRLSADKVGPWHETKASPQLEGRALFDKERPVRWLLDDTLPVEPPPAAWIELAGGDVLPGRVVGFQSGAELSALRLPPHFEVSPYATVDWPDGPARSRIRILSASVRRIVWQPATRSYRPQTLFFRDGRQLDFRVLRFAPSGVQLLREEGIQEVAFEEIAELHLAPTDPWEAWLDQLAALVPDGQSRLMQVETTGGLRATTSMDRFQARTRGGPDDAANWHHLVQPAWSLDPFWLPHTSIRWRRWFAPHEIPLSAVEPVATRQESDLGGPWPVRSDRNVEGGALASGGQRFAWGFGIHANCGLEFLLPEIASGFQTRLGLDQIVGDGGCVRAKVRIGTKSVYESPVIVGAADSHDTGRLTLASTPGGTRLVLQVEALRDGRPAGADPFGIRAHFDWLEPIVDLDPGRVKADLVRRAALRIPAWQGWKVGIGNRPGARLVNHWDEVSQRAPGYRLLAVATDESLSLSRSLRIADAKDQLLLAVNRPPQSSASKIEVRVEGKILEKDGKPSPSLDVPVRHSEKPPEPLWISLEEFRGRQVQVEILQKSADDK